MAKNQSVKTLRPKVPVVKDTKAYDAALEKAGVGSQHKGGTSSQRGRSTILFKDGERIVIRENSEVVRPDLVKPLKRMKMSVFNALEASNSITYVDKSRYKK